METRMAMKYRPLQGQATQRPPRRESATGTITTMRHRQHNGFTTGTKASTTRTPEDATSHGSLAAASLDRTGSLPLA
ncbi:hypothetical protein DPSP01_006234 [Paraphaeosphaeria sporulosa]